MLHVGKKNRTVGATLMNQDSSRSHSIFTITIETSDASFSSDGEAHIRRGKLNLVDLAGSERQSKTGYVNTHAPRCLVQIRIAHSSACA